MDKLTWYDEDGRLYCRRGYEVALARLASYEATELMPDEIVKMGMMFEDSKRYSGRLELKLNAATKRMPKWVSVKERLPEDRSNVLVVAYWHERWGVYMGWCAPERAEWSVHVGIGDRSDVAVVSLCTAIGIRAWSARRSFTAIPANTSPPPMIRKTARLSRYIFAGLRIIGAADIPNAPPAGICRTAWSGVSSAVKGFYPTRLPRNGASRRRKFAWTAPPAEERARWSGQGRAATDTFTVNVQSVVAW